MTNEPTVLVVDDNEDLLETFSMILKRRGFRVTTAGNGPTAIDLYREYGFDVILMDIVMPEMDGVAALRRIKEIDPEATVIMMTAYSNEETIQTAKNEGARRVIRKPVKIDLLIDMIREAAGEETILVINRETKAPCGAARESLAVSGV